MLAFYPQIKHVHIAAALCSGTLFVLRGGFRLHGARWPMAAPVRWLSVAVDTTLLTAALMLLTLLPRAVFANGWLAVKLALVVTYIALGSFALRRARGRRAQVLCYAGALLVFLSIYATARAHSPLGAWLWWFG